MMQPSIIFMQCSCLGMQPCLGLLPLVEPLKQFFMGYCKFVLEDIIFLGESKNLVLLTLQPNWRVRCHWYTYQWYLTMPVAIAVCLCWFSSCRCVAGFLFLTKNKKKKYRIGICAGVWGCSLRFVLLTDNYVTMCFRSF